MPKKLCCCTNKQTCPWCDNATPNQIGPAPYNNLTGTVNTEIPSVGHPYFNNWPDTYPPSGLCADSHFRTIPTQQALSGVCWTEQNFYGDLYPSWFNGINMNQTLTSTETNAETAYFEFLFKLKIEKQNNNGQYTTIIDIDWNGYGKNLRPHPDACQSYNLTNDLFNKQICSALNADFLATCTLDFARMPRGPWPYKRKTGIIGGGGGPGGPGGDVEGELDELSDEGTPYGWEDCPDTCPNYSNYQTPIENLKFFKWLSPHCRYTTPEWDVSDFTKNGNRKVSIHCLVPSKVKEEDYTEGTPWCNPLGQYGQSYGEWCFGMDLESPSEITALDAAQFPWSNGREADGFWINKTPTNALRVLFTLDHADLEPGKVFRVFRDWHVQNGTHELYKINNQSEKFKITFEQKLTERIFSSLGCDCPEENCERSPENPTDPEGLFACWTCNLSFTERGPLFVKMSPTTKNTGRAIIPNDPEADGCESGALFSSDLCENNGLIMFADSDLSSNGTYLPAVFPYHSSVSFGDPNIPFPFLNHMGDMPYGPGSPYSVLINKYRSVYRAIKVLPEEYRLEDPAFYPYGWKQCTKADGSQIFNDPYGILNNKLVYETPFIKLSPWPQKHYIDRCSIDCGCPSLTECYNGCNDCVSDVKCHNSPECVDNLIREKAYGYLCGSNCLSYPNDCTQAFGNIIQPYCDGSPGFERLGMGCDLLFFNAFTSIPTYGGLGPQNCSCVCSDLQETTGGDDNCIQDGRCKFCSGGGLNSQSAGFLLNTSFNWREMLCYRAKSNPDKLLSVIPPNIMGNMKVKCELSGQCPTTDTGLHNIHGKCDCEFLNTYGNASLCTPDDEVTNKTYLSSIADSGMDIQGQVYEINFSAYGDNGAEVGQFKAYPTKYKEQYFSPRIPKYIKINAQGPFTL